MIRTGIDIVDICRVKKLYRNYKNRLHRYLSKNELVWLSKSKRKVEALAQIMAIKEAVFKSLEIPWFGLEGWKRIGLMKTNGKVNVSISKEFLKREKGKMNFWIATAQTKEFVVAHVIFENLAYDSRP